jgi:hypothetical protein
MDSMNDNKDVAMSTTYAKPTITYIGTLRELTAAKANFAPPIPAPGGQRTRPKPPTWGHSGTTT